MNKSFLSILILLTAGASEAQSQAKTNPGSLFTQDACNPFLDRTARREGDIVTILISESSVATFAAQTQASKKESALIEKGLGPVLQHLIPRLGLGTSSSFQGGGSTSQSGKFLAKMSVIVKQLLPNGQMVIEGKRYLKVNKDTQTFTLSGIIRRDDIRSDNTILSEYIAEAEIRAEGKGVITEKQRRGLLSRFLDLLF